VWTPPPPPVLRLREDRQTYLLANILPCRFTRRRHATAVHRRDSTSRDVCVQRDSVRVIQDLPPGAPVDGATQIGVSMRIAPPENWLLTLPEQPKYMNFGENDRPEDFTADCLRYRIRIRVKRKGQTCCARALRAAAARTSREYRHWLHRWKRTREEIWSAECEKRCAGGASASDFS